MKKPHSRRDVGLGAPAAVLDGAFFRSVVAGLRNGAIVVSSSKS